MLAFLGKPDLKVFVLEQLAAHRAADQLIKGTYSKYIEDERADAFKGCAVGCTLEAVRRYNGNHKKRIRHNDHSAYERELGIPWVLAHLEDRFFENLPDAEAQAWPERFTSAIRPGADLTMIWPRFALWLLSEEVPQHTKSERSRAALSEVAVLYHEWCEGTKPSAERWLSVRQNASAAYATYDAATAATATTALATTAAHAAYADDAAYAAYAADDAASAAATAADNAADDAAAYTAYTAYTAATTYAAADAAAHAATAAYTAAYAADAARRDCYRRMSDKLIELLGVA